MLRDVGYAGACPTLVLSTAAALSRQTLWLIHDATSPPHLSAVLPCAYSNHETPQPTARRRTERSGRRCLARKPGREHGDRRPAGNNAGASREDWLEALAAGTADAD